MQKTKHAGSIPGSGRPPGEGHGNPLPYSCLENPMDRGTWWGGGYSPQDHKWLDMIEATQHNDSNKKDAVITWHDRGVS